MWPSIPFDTSIFMVIRIFETIVLYEAEGRTVPMEQNLFQQKLFWVKPRKKK
ncbi:MAG: hypothetical protein ACW99A_00620 [Candidatus Kariarchaeaceae archaeon]